MRVKTVQIVWHGGEQAANQGRKKQEDGIKLEPVYSLDFHPSGALATAGADKEVKLWKVGCCAECTQEAGRMWHAMAAKRRRRLPHARSQVERGLDGYAQVEYTGSIVGHQKTVNCVRFSPTGVHHCKAAAGRAARSPLLAACPSWALCCAWRRSGRTSACIPPPTCQLPPLPGCQANGW